MPVVMPEISYPTAECPEPRLWHCYEHMSAELEVLEFLGSIVKTLKPKLVVETGTFNGWSACHIGKALRWNERGRLITCEVDPKLHKTASEVIAANKLQSVVECRLQSSLDLEVSEPIDILFCDSDSSIRVSEIKHFWKQLTPNSLIIVHDVNSVAHKPLREAILGTENDGLSVIMLPTPRGLALAQKREGRQ